MAFDISAQKVADFAYSVLAALLAARRSASFRWPYPLAREPRKAVTQQFNTTTSMGRLTLNVLLFFAQFERERSFERVRDKIAASRRKGKWTGGSVPLGYDANAIARALDVDAQIDDDPFERRQGQIPSQQAERN